MRFLLSLILLLSFVQPAKAQLQNLLSALQPDSVEVLIGRPGDNTAFWSTSSSSIFPTLLASTDSIMASLQKYGKNVGNYSTLLAANSAAVGDVLIVNETVTINGNVSLNNAALYFLEGGRIAFTNATDTLFIDQPWGSAVKSQIFSDVGVVIFGDATEFGDSNGEVYLEYWGGDGLTAGANNKDAWDRAITSMSAQTNDRGGRIRLLNGRYVHNATVDLQGPIQIIGTGEFTSRVRVGSNDITLFRSNNENYITFRDVALDGLTNGTDTTLAFTDASHLVMENVSIQGGDFGLVLIGGSEARLTDVEISVVDSAHLLLDPGTTGMTKPIISNSKFVTSDAYSIWIKGHYPNTPNVDSYIFENVTLSTADSVAVRADSAGAGSWKTIDISNGSSGFRFNNCWYTFVGGRTYVESSVSSQTGDKAIEFIDMSNFVHVDGGTFVMNATDGIGLLLDNTGNAIIDGGDYNGDTTAVRVAGGNSTGIRFNSTAVSNSDFGFQEVSSAQGNYYNYTRHSSITETAYSLHNNNNKSGTSDNEEWRISSTAPNFRLFETDAAANNGLWDWVASGEELQLRTLNDAVSASQTVMEVERTGTTVDRVDFVAGNFSVGTGALVDEIIIVGQHMGFVVGADTFYTSAVDDSTGF